MSLLYDQHLHSFHSIDSETPPAENVKAALGAGLGGLVFTEHFDSHPDEWDTCRYDDDIYSRDIAELRSLFQDQIFIGKGIEICYQPSRWEFILEHLSAHTFDLVILSVHWSETGPIQYRQWWEQFPTVHDAADEYLRTVLKAVSDAERAAGELGRRVFDVLGHLDLVKRYALFIAGTEDVQVDPVLLDDILLTCIQADLTPEVNTSLLRQGGSEPMPG
ncbi:MAG TPA: hypothetical protein ENJ06_06090, partial [Phycisphaeraceae bacterium]|nr:hypothetical protein [Phycisphaeraceae bacterium]